MAESGSPSTELVRRQQETVKTVKAGDNVDISMKEGSAAVVPHAKFKGNKSKNSEMITIEINLTDPEDLAKKLEMIDLTDEETDELLRQALDLNKRLRKELNRQTLLEKPIMARSTSFVVSAPASGVGGTRTSKSSLPPVRTKGRDGLSKNSVKSSRSGSGLSSVSQRTSPPLHSQPSPYLQKSASEIRKTASRGSATQSPSRTSSSQKRSNVTWKPQYQGK